MKDKVKIKYTNRQFKTTPKHLRDLPSELVTHDAHDRERVHKHDPDHVRKPLLKEAAKRMINQVPPLVRAQIAIQLLFDKLSQDPFRFNTLDQEVVDLWKARTLLSWAKKSPIPDELRHLWFPEPNGKSVGLKEGPAPGRGDRPKHLKNLNLEIHVLDWPARMRDIVKAAGVNVEDTLEEIRATIQRQKFHAAALAAKTH